MLGAIDWAAANRLVPRGFLFAPAEEVPHDEALFAWTLQSKGEDSLAISAA